MLFTYVNSTSFAPTDIPNLALWLDASDSGTITQVAGSVSQWNDKSGNGRNAVQATGAQQPQTGVRTLNGRNVLEFDGVDDSFGVASFAFSQPITYITAVVPDRTGSPNDMYIHDGYNGTRNASIFGGSFQYFAGTALPSGGTVVASTPYIIMTEFNGAGSRLRVNGVTQATGDPGGDGISSLRIGARGAGGANSPWDGVIAEFLAYNRILTTAEKNQIGQYLSAEWGVPWTNI